MRPLLTLGAVAFVAIVSVACTTQPIMNVNDAIVTAGPGKTVTKDQVRAAIVRAGGALGWQMRDESPDQLSATLVLRGHTAVVDIPYSDKSYSIKYRSSVNLNESGGSIHKNYNGWVQNLTRNINTQLSLL